MILLRRHKEGGRDCFQAVLVRPTGETLSSPLFFSREGVVKWVMRALNAQPTSTPSPSNSKAG